MKLRAAASLFSVVLVACASAQRPEPVAATSSAALTSADAGKENASSTSTKTAAEAWAEKKIAAEAETVNKEAPAREALDPLATGSELEESSIPNVEITPASQVRAKGPGELNAAVRLVNAESSVDGATRKLTQRLGQPTWTETPKGSDAKRRVWVASTGATCHRLVLEADGSVEVETASKSEWRMLTASARQNPCTGEIKRGITNK